MGEESSPLHEHITTSLEEEVHGKHPTITVHDHHHHKKNKITKHHRYARTMGYGIGSMVAATIVAILLLAGIAALVVWLVYRPQKPRFMVVGAAIITPINSNTSLPLPPYLISTSMQFSVVTTNPNKRDSISYDHLSAFVTYHNQMITAAMPLPPFYHEKHTSVQMAPVLGGTGIPVSQDVLYRLGMDEAIGVVPMRLVILGRLKWKAGAITSAHYHVYVNCDVLLRLNNGFVGQVALVSAPPCKVDV